MNIKSILKNPLLLGTLLLTGTGILVRIIGFFYRIYLSRTLGAEGMGLYQLVFPVYSICHALCCGALQTALSRFVAIETAKSNDRHTLSYLLSACLLALTISLGLAICMHSQSAWISTVLLLEPRCETMLKIMALALPFNAVHACIYGYYYGLKRVQVPSLSQLLEQVFRVLVVTVLFEQAKVSGQPPSVTVVIIGLVAGEIIALLFSFVCFTRHLSAMPREPFYISGFFWHTKQLCKLYIPLCLNRLTLTLLQSAEAVLIPGSLQIYGLSTSDALSLYGTLTGMALPFILFPTAITNSLSVMLLPDIAEASEQDDDLRISQTTGLTLRYCLYIGILFVGIFCCYGKDMGTILFHNVKAGTYIQTLAWLCPFLYVAATISSVLNGLELANHVFIHSLAGLTLRLGFIVFGVSQFGITAYLYGALLSQLLITGLHLLSFCKRYPLPFHAGYTLFRPILICAFCCFFTQTVLKKTAIVVFGSPFLTLAAHCACFSMLFLFLLYLSRNRSIAGIRSI